MKEKGSYTGVLCKFPPVVFPGVLISFARVLELVLAEIACRSYTKGDLGLGLALSEGTAVLDRLGNFCFTGDPKVLPVTVLGAQGTKTIESIEKGR